ncbi:MAG: hydrolase [Pirellulaceae bacterium]|nr:hydrolase [Pirellulaceae bacterium]
MEIQSAPETHARLPRSPELMSRDDTALLVVDIQEKLIPHIRDRERLVWNVRRLLDAARVLGIPAAATEQYPRGLGATVPEIAARLGEIPSKLTFSCGQCGGLFEPWADAGRSKILVVGIETHVCVLQTVMDLLHDGFRVYVAVDAVGSRFELDYQTALRRIEMAGGVLTTSEAAMFEWTEVAGSPEFKEISRLAREESPTTASL